MLEREIDIAHKMALAIQAMSHHPKAGSEMKVFLLLDKVYPYELSVADIERVTGLSRQQVGVAVAVLTDWGYVTEKAGSLSRAK